MIFDIAATAAARCFYSKPLDALGVQTDVKCGAMNPMLQAAFTVGRRVARSERSMAQPRPSVIGAIPSCNLQATGP